MPTPASLVRALALALALSSFTRASAQPSADEAARWKREAKSVTIVRDDWGIAHIYGHTDADAVFGMLYAQAEDDFNRVETNYINAMGRLAEAEGKSQIYRDLRMKLFIVPDSMRARYRASPQWLKALMNSWADGLNYYLYTHPDVTPRVIKRFEPWMALTFTEGSIGGDIEGISVKELEAFYGGQSPEAPSAASGDGEPSGSNGMAVAPSNTLSHHALLLINPHTSFFFRSELQVVSDEGLDVYGAATWGQLFVYQGFNDRCGWMHTSSNADAVDEYAETVTKKGDRFYYRYAGKDIPMTATKVTVAYKTPSGMSKEAFTVYRTRHGPIVRRADGKWISVRLMQEPLKALTQSYSRTKARSYKEFRRIMDLHTNSSNNTTYADADGNIAYFHGNFIPKRDPSFDWTRPVDGSNPATDWHGLLSVDETPHLLNPPSGWLYNSNDWPWSAAGPGSLKRADYPEYVETGGPSARGAHAVLVLKDRKDFTLESLMAAAYDSYLPAFAELIPSLVAAYDSAAEGPLKSKIAEQVALLRGWDYRWSPTSVPTTVAIFWGEDLARRVTATHAFDPAEDEFYVNVGTADQRLEALAAASDTLTARFGTWKTPWGDINRFQRLTGDLVQPFSDTGPSIPVGFTSAQWGSLAAFGARAYPGTVRRYGTSGNTFVAVVEFGDTVRAKAISPGGESGHPASPHFGDQAQRYSTGALRDVYFYRSQLTGHTERTYHPGAATAGAAAGR